MSEYRKDFPILRQKINGAPLCYLDNAASAQCPQIVIDAMSEAKSQAYANIHRGLHYLANKATEQFENARTQVANFIGATHREEIIFTSGATDSINLVSYSFLEPQIEAGDEIILSVMEHHSNIVPWHFLRTRKGAKLKYLPLEADGTISLEKAAGFFTPKTKMLAITQTSNVLGTNTPLKELIKLAHQNKVPVLVDGCQGVVHGLVNMQELDCDFYVFSAHKLYGPNGIGVLFGKKELLEQMRPFKGGGQMITDVTQDEISYGNLPYKFEAGTPAIVEAVGLSAALDYIENIGWGKIHSIEAALYEEMLAALNGINQLTLLGCQTFNKAPIISLTTKVAHPHDIAQILDKQGVAIRAGHHCAQPLMAALGVSATARASLAFYNNSEDIRQLAKALRIAIDFFI